MLHQRMILPLMFAAACSSADQADRAAAESAKAQAKEVVECFVTGDFHRMATKTLPVVVQGMGGAEAMAKRMAAGLKQGPSIEGVEVRDATVHRRSPSIYSFVPFTLRLRVSGRTEMKDSHLLGVSNDGGKVWHFVDCAGLSPKKVKVVLPDFPDDLELPTVR